MHGSTYARLRTSGVLRDRFRKIINVTATVCISFIYNCCHLGIFYTWISSFTPDAGLAHLSDALNYTFTAGKVTTDYS